MANKVNYIQTIDISIYFTYDEEIETPKMKEKPEKWVLVIFDVIWQLKCLYDEPE